jgi:hypothetical protein
MSKAFEAWFNRFNEEKGVDPEQIIEVEGPSGVNIMPLQVVFDAIKSTSDAEQAGIKAMIVKIDFANADVVGYYKHLAQAIAK